jgi:hypothetical protein
MAKNISRPKIIVNSSFFTFSIYSLFVIPDLIRNPVFVRWFHNRTHPIPRYVVGMISFELSLFTDLPKSS